MPSHSLCGSKTVRTGWQSQYAQTIGISPLLNGGYGPLETETPHINMSRKKHDTKARWFCDLRFAGTKQEERRNSTAKEVGESMGWSQFTRLLSTVFFSPFLNWNQPKTKPVDRQTPPNSLTTEKASSLYNEINWHHSTYNHYKNLTSNQITSHLGSWPKLSICSRTLLKIPDTPVSLYSRRKQTKTIPLKCLKPNPWELQLISFHCQGIFFRQGFSV